MMDDEREDLDDDRPDPAGSGRKVSPRDVRRTQLEALLLSGASIVDAARRVGVSERTARRYAAESRERLDAVVRERDGHARRALDRLARAADVALETLVIASANNWQAAARLLALVLPRKMEHDVGDTTSALLERVAEIRARAQTQGRWPRDRVDQLERVLREHGIAVPPTEET